MKNKKPLKPEEVPELRADRDDALGYSREQFVFENEKTVHKRAKKKKKKANKTKRKTMKK